jgi:hypothetical protein
MVKGKLKVQSDNLRSVANFAIVLNILNSLVFLTFFVGQTKLAHVEFSFLTVVGTLILFAKIKRYKYGTSSLIRLISLQRVVIFAVVSFQLSNIFKFQEWSWDGLWYHSPAARTWSRQFDFTSLYPSSFANSYPGSTETFQAIIWHFIPNAPSQIGNYLLFILILILIRKLLLGLGMPSRIAESALLVFMLTPTVFSQSLTSYNDVIFGSVVFLSIALSIKYHESGEKNIFLGALSFSSIAASIKYQGVVLFAFIFTILILRFISTRKKSGTLPIEQKKAFGFKGILSIVLVLVTGFAWEIKNWLNYGNPLHPFDFGFGPLILINGKLGSPNTAFLNNESDLAGFSNSPLSFIEAAWHFIPNYTYDARHGGFGILWPLILSGAFIFSLKMRGTFQKIFLISILFTLITPANWWSRYQIHLFLAGLFVVIHVLSGKHRLKDLSLKLIISVTVFQLIIYAPFVGPYPIFFPQPTNFESFKTPWENPKFTDEFFSLPNDGQRSIAPELLEISEMEGKDIAFWWIEPLILPLMGTGEGNRLFEVTGSRAEIKEQLEGIRPNFFVTRQDLTKVEVPRECVPKKNEAIGIYYAKVFECEWNAM